MSGLSAAAEQQMFVLLILTLLGLLVQIGFLIVSITTVRRASPEASTWLTTAASVSLVTMIVHPIATAALPYFVGPGTEDYFRGLTAVTVIFGLVGLATACAQLLGIVRLAESRKGDPR